MMHGWYDGGGYAFIFMAVFWVAAIAAVVFLIRSLTGSSVSHTEAPRESALDILKRRYASGEIDKAEYEEKSRDLKA